MNDKDDILITGDVTIDISGYGAAGPSYTLGSGIDTITIDNTMLNSVNWQTGSSGNGYTITNAGAGYSYTTGGAGIWGNTDASVNIDTNGINVKEGGDIKIGGKSLSDAIEKIEERLGILNPNPELEERWEQLKDLRKQYLELEKDILEKEKLIKILKEQ